MLVNENKSNLFRSRERRRSGTQLAGEQNDDVDHKMIRDFRESERERDMERKISQLIRTDPSTLRTAQSKQQQHKRVSSAVARKAFGKLDTTTSPPVVLTAMP